MREIKFRVWDSKHNVMVTKNNVEELVKEYDDFDNGDYCTDEWYPYCRIYVPFDIILQEDKIIMQYTGLKDKNGVEIYEGDIVEYKDSTGLHREEVKFDYGCFFAGFHNGSSTRYAPKLINTRIAKVIGNIYENKELLKDD